MPRTDTDRNVNTTGKVSGELIRNNCISNTECKQQSSDTFSSNTVGTSNETKPLCIDWLWTQHVNAPM